MNTSNNGLRKHVTFTRNKPGNSRINRKMTDNIVKNFNANANTNSKINANSEKIFTSKDQKLGDKIIRNNIMSNSGTYNEFRNILISQTVNQSIDLAATASAAVVDSATGGMSELIVGVTTAAANQICKDTIIEGVKDLDKMGKIGQNNFLILMENLNNIEFMLNKLDEVSENESLNQNLLLRHSDQKQNNDLSSSSKLSMVLKEDLGLNDEVVSSMEIIIDDPEKRKKLSETLMFAKIKTTRAVKNQLDSNNTKNLSKTVGLIAGAAAGGTLVTTGVGTAITPVAVMGARTLAKIAVYAGANIAIQSEEKHSTKENKEAWNNVKSTVRANKWNTNDGEALRAFFKVVDPQIEIIEEKNQMLSLNHSGRIGKDMGKTGTIRFIKTSFTETKANTPTIPTIPAIEEFYTPKSEEFSQVNPFYNK